MMHEHPDANLLAAFAEKKLLAHEREELLAHLAECADCREVVALTSVNEQTGRPKPLSPVWRWGSAAAAAALILIGVWGLRLSLLPPTSKTAPPAAVPPRSDIALSSAPAEIAPQRQIIRAPKRLAGSAPPKRLKPSPITPEPEVAREMAPKQFARRASGGIGLTAAKGFLPQTRVLWNVSAAVVERSFDGGITWQPVPISEGTEFQAVAGEGSEVWAGGAHGALFHSTDGGASWKQVAVGGGGELLNGSILAIRLPDRADIILETDSGQQWASRDGGLSWKHL
ncbi:MAG TPA: YCF48-related protein [Bryobacteraceae bacterium]|jgi:hypothetical protein|nr:YCF48-related protein [Bryobacteraceae bacterium]